MGAARHSPGERVSVNEAAIEVFVKFEWFRRFSLPCSAGWLIGHESISSIDLKMF